MDRQAENNAALRNVFLFQGAYFVITGVWPVVNMPSFISATGPKQDTWLVEMVGLLAISIGLSFLVASLRKQPLPIVLAYASALSFLLMDLIYVIGKVIPGIYLIDAAVQFVFISLMTFFLIRRSNHR